MKKEENYHLSKEYNEFLNEIVALVQSHRVIAIQSVQSVSNLLYWNIGELIIRKQKLYGWGKSVVERLSVDLTANIGNGVSWSSRNLWFMRQLVDAYTKVKQPVSELEKVKQLKQNDDHPSIGILLVPHKDHLEVEYALKLASKPIGVSKYKISKNLPENLTGKLPGTKEFQRLLTHKSEG